MTITEQPPIIGRFTYLESPVALPGACGVCLNERGPFIDTALSFPGHGAFIICVRCLSFMADVANLATSDLSKSRRRAIYAKGLAAGAQKVLANVEKAISDIVQSELDLALALEKINSDEPIGDLSSDNSVPDSDPLSVFASDSVETASQESDGDESDSGEPDTVNLKDDSTPVVEGPDDVSGDPGDGELPVLPI